MATQELTAEEKRQFDMKRTSLFKGTIAVIVIYGALLLLLSLVGVFFETARQMIFSDGFIFTVTLMAGIVLVIIMLMIQVFTYKEAPKEVVAGENLVCPEYWELRKTPLLDMNRITDVKAKALSTYHCINPATPIFNSTTIKTAGATTEVTTLNSVAAKYNNSQKLTCNRLYPEYMAFMDKQTFPEAPTTLRKEYLKQCATTSQGTTPSTITIDWPAVSP